MDDITPADTYAIAFVRGISAHQALAALGVVRRDAGPMTAAKAVDLVLRLAQPDTYEGPPVVQVDERDGGLVVYLPYGFLSDRRLAALSSNGVAAAFSTTVELDTSIVVAEKGRRVRRFDPYYYDAHERRGALPQERGIRFSDDRGFTPAWEFLDRMTSIHVDRTWLLDTPHPTYVLDGTT